MTHALDVAVQVRDGVDLRLRVGLNSGQGIAGEIGSGAFGYTGVGEQVGMAQRMESVAAPGGVMLSASTARPVEGAAALTDPELVQIKGADEPVPARWLLSMGERPAGFSGIRYWARHDLAHTAGCLALFGPADPSKSLAGFELDNTDHLPGRTALLNQLEQETGITVLPLPPI